jgi:S1-C subfamily serine protease
MVTRTRAALSFAVILGAGFLGGLVLSGRLALTSPTDAAPEPQAATAQAPGATRAAVAAASGGLPDLSAVAERALRVSANISSTTMVPVDPFLQFWYGADRVQPSQSLGSGVVVSPDGYVLTNTHVIGNAEASIRVTLEDGRDRPARLIGIDEVSDLAVVKIDATNLQTIPWGDSSKLRVAEWVLAVGNPFQLSGTVTLGIVSTKLRSGDQVGSYQDFIQTDAAINPGNSGGALINARGELVGINTMIVSRSGGNQGLGFAIPSNAAREIMNALIKNGVVAYGWIGSIEFITIDEAIAARNNLDFTGAFVRSLSRLEPAYRAGLRPGDTVVAVNGQPVISRDQIDRVVVRQAIGSTVRLDVISQTGRRSTIEVPVARRQPQPQTR